MSLCQQVNHVFETTTTITISTCNAGQSSQMPSHISQLLDMWVSCGFGTQPASATHKQGGKLAVLSQQDLVFNHPISATYARLTATCCSTLTLHGHTHTCAPAPAHEMISHKRAFVNILD
jgi:hypothetical protein